MNKVLAVAAALTCLAASGASANPPGEFDGMFNVTKTSPGCGGFPVKSGSGTLMRFLPPGVANNGIATRIVLRDYFQQGSMQSYALASGTLVGETAIAVKFALINTDAHNGKAKVQISSQEPAAITASTHAVKLTGKIIGYQGNPDCTVNFSAILYSY